VVAELLLLEVTVLIHLLWPVQAVLEQRPVLVVRRSHTLVAVAVAIAEGAAPVVLVVLEAVVLVGLILQPLRELLIRVAVVVAEEIQAETAAQAAPVSSSSKLTDKTL